MYILGISNGYVATATLVKDGKVVASVSEERFNGIKSYNGFPRESILWCLKKERITGKDLDLVTTPYRFRPPLFAPSEQKAVYSSLSILFYLSVGVGKARDVFRWLRYHMPFLRGIGIILYRVAAYTIGAYYTKKHCEYIAQFLHISKDKVVAFDHHLSHAASAYYASPYNKQKVLVVTLDAEGDNVSGSVNIFHNTEISILSRISRENSLGYLYGLVTKYLGMKPHEHEYKVMGLAPYANSYDVDKLFEKLSTSIQINPHNPLQFKTICNAQDFEIYLRDKFRYARFDHLAGAIQRLVETMTTELIKNAINQTGIHTVILSGGVFMNIKANQKIAELKQVNKLYILPSCADETASLGSCYLGQRSLQAGNELAIQPISTIYWGPSIEDDEIQKVLRKYTRSDKYTIRKYIKIEHKIASLLAKGNIVAHMAGSMEFGARALGNRSLLADARNLSVVQVINDMIKKRDFWMPFTPSILEERANDYFINNRKIDPFYMIISFNSTPLARRDLAAAIHPYDFTIRPQLVKKSWNARYYKILKEFEKLTGVGGILNTSFNLHGYPIAKGPEEAFYILEHSNLAYLVLNNYLIIKNI